MDEVSLHRLSLLHPAIRQDAIKAYNKAVKDTPIGIHPFITQTLRTFKEQAVLYAQGRTSPGRIVTNAKPGQSYHQYGLALDFVLQIGGKFIWEVDKNWMIVVNCFLDFGFTWGGDGRKLKDYPHFEKNLRHNWKLLLSLHDQKVFIDGSDYIDFSLI